MSTTHNDAQPKPVKPVSISSGGNIPIGREKEPEKKNCSCGGKGCCNSTPDKSQPAQK